MRERTLLERLEQPDPPGERQVGLDEERLRESIRRSLQRLLNSRHGGSPTVPDYGTPEFEELFRSGQSADGSLVSQIERTIEKYEPRLRNVRVGFVTEDDEPMRLRFDITAVMMAGDEETPTVFRSLVETSGRVSVKG